MHLHIMLLTLSVLFVVLIALFAIPYDVRGLLTGRSIDYRAGRPGRKILPARRFCIGFILGAVVPALLIVATVLSNDARVVHSDLAEQAVHEGGESPSSSLAPNAEANLVDGSNDSPQQVEKSTDQATTTGSLREWQAVSLFIVIAFACVAFVLRQTSHGYLAAITDAIFGTLSKDRRNTSNHYLKNTAQQSLRD